MDRPWELDRKGVGLLILGLIALGLSVRPLGEGWVLARLRNDGKSAPARVVETGVVTSGRRTTDLVRYEFLAEGETVPRQRVERLHRGPLSSVMLLELPRRASRDELTARYLPSNPSIHRLEIDLPGRLRRARIELLIFLGLGVMLVAPGVRMLWLGRGPGAGFRRARRHSRAGR